MPCEDKEGGHRGRTAKAQATELADASGYTFRRFLLRVYSSKITFKFITSKSCCEVASPAK